MFKRRKSSLIYTNFFIIINYNFTSKSDRKLTIHSMLNYFFYYKSLDSDLRETKRK